MDLSLIKQRVIDADEEGAVKLTREAIAAGHTADRIFKESLFPAMHEVGRRMQCNEYFLPEVLLSAHTMQACAAVLRPLILKEPAVKPVGKAVVCTVSGDLHDIGKNLVSLMLEGVGFSVIDLGHNCSAERVVAAVREHQPDVLGLSAMLTTTMLNMKGILDALAAAGLRDRVHVMVGGAPLDDRFAREIGADFYGEDAPRASTHARDWISDAAG